MTENAGTPPDRDMIIGHGVAAFMLMQMLLQVLVARKIIPVPIAQEIIKSAMLINDQIRADLPEYGLVFEAAGIRLQDCLDAMTYALKQSFGPYTPPF